ncbi:hypothetical protein EBU99_05295 [bacterium]|nr:hypothetical protein [bacterium]
MHDLLQLMYQDGHLSSTELAALRRTSRQLGENPVRVLRSLNVATSGEIKELLQRYYGFAAATDKVIEEMDDSLRALIPADIALHYCVLPIAEENQDLYVLIEDPTDKGTLGQLQFFLEKRIIPVIATVQQLSNGLCRLYGVEPGRLKLSSLLEASRGAVGISSSLNSSQAHFLDDAQPLLDDDIFKKLKVSGRRKPPLRATLPEEDTPPKKAPRLAKKATPAPQKAESPTQAQAAVPEAIEPELAAALNVLGLRLSLARNRSEAVAMTNERLAEFRFQLELISAHELMIRWNDNTIQVGLEHSQGPLPLPQALRSLLKKIAQCSPE